MLILLYFVKSNVREGTVDLDPFVVISDNVMRDLWFTSKSDFDSSLIFLEGVVENFKFEIFANHMKANRVVLNIVFDYFRFVLSDAPKQNASLPMVVDNTVFEEEGAQSANNADSVFLVVAFNL